MMVPLYLAIITAQVLSVSTQNVYVNVTPEEYQIGLSWLETEYEVNYTLGHRFVRNLTYTTLDNTLISPGPGVKTYIVGDLKPGRLYQIILLRNGDTLFSDILATKPLPPVNITVEQAGHNNLLIRWSVDPTSVQDSYRVFVTGVTNSSEVYQSEPLVSTVYDVTDLLPGHEYIVTVVSISHNQTSSFTSHIQDNTVPLQPTIQHISARSNSSLAVSWTPDIHSVQDSVQLTAAFNNTIGEMEEVPVSCTLILFETTCITQTLPGIPGQTLVLGVYALKGTRRSSSHSLYYSTMPDPMVDIQEISSSTSSLNLLLVPPRISSYFHYNLVLLNADGFLERNISLKATQTQVDLQNLTSGSPYNVTVTIRSAFEDSELYWKMFYTDPFAPGAIRTNDMKYTSLEVSWLPVASGSLGYYQIEIFPQEKGTISPVMDYTIDKRTAIFERLIPGKRYNISVRSAINKKKSEAVYKVAYTKPYPPDNLTYVIRSGREVDIHWTAPFVGILEGYILTLTSDSYNASVHEASWSQTHYRFDRLHPGTSYTVAIVSKSGSVVSPDVKVSFTTTPSLMAELYVDHAGTNFINISWSRPHGTDFDSFRLEISPIHAVSPVNILESESYLHHTFTGLRPGSLYNLTLSTMSNGSSIDESSVLVLTLPPPVLNLNVSSHNVSSLFVVWTVSDSQQQTHFEVVSKSNYEESNYTWPIVQVIQGQTEYHETLQNLAAGSMYNIWVRAVQIQENITSYSQWEFAHKTTKPKPVTSLEYTLTGHNVELSWQPGVNSTQDHYLIWYRETLLGHEFGWEQIRSSVTQQILTKLFPGERYEIYVFAVSYYELSPRQEALMLQIPPLPVTDFGIIAPLTTTSSFTLMWTYNRTNTYVEGYKLEYLSYNTGTSKSMTILNPNATMSLTLDSLNSGETYFVSLTSFVKNVSSESRMLNVTLRPICLTNLTEGAFNSTNAIAIEYVAADNYFEYYQFTLTNQSSHQPIKKAKDDSDRNVFFDSLQGGTEYEAKVVCVSGSEISDPKYITLQTVPNLPSLIERSSHQTEILLTIHKPAGHVDSYVTSCFLNSVPCGNHVVQAKESKQIIRFDGLKPYTTYTFQVVVVAGYKQNSTFLQIKTSQSAPSGVQDLKVTEIAPLKVNLTWRAPTHQNGILTAFIVDYFSDNLGEIDNSEKNITLTGSQPFQETFSYTFSQLKAGRSYTFIVKAKTVSLGASAFTYITMRTYHPPLKEGFTPIMASPREVLDSTIKAITPTSIVVNFTNAFSEKYGPIMNYTVIVSMDSKESYSNTPVLPGWKAVQNDPAVKSYQAIANCSNFFQERSTCNDMFRIHKRSVEVNFKAFEIGSEKHCGTRYYCNGPLKQNTTYYIKLRAYTVGGYSDTNYSKPFVTAAVKKDGDLHGTDVGAIVGGVLGGIVGVALIILILIVMRRNMRQKSNMYKGGHSSNMTPRSSVRRTKKSHAVRVAEFRDHTRAMSADSDFKYAEEFEDLKEIGREQSCCAAELPVNRGKNRFTNILPYDHSRVKLLPTDDEEGSDYINANYMPGYTSKREYIVTQGPLPGTRDDFWRMMWEQNSRNIVMLTKCVEKGREKCDFYWPRGTDAMFYGDLQVAVLNETKFPSWTITEFKLSLGDISRQIRHFHFTAWPDFGVPEKPQTLLRFVRTVRGKLIRECGPMVVHCSAGVGRSGTFIALDRLLQYIKENSQIDIFQTVAEMRKERVWMVQTEQQYICVHQCLLCVIEGREDEHVYENAAFGNAGFEEDEGINVEIP